MSRRHESRDAREFTAVERFIDERAHRILDRAPSSRARAFLVEFAVFTLKQAWACAFGAALLVVLLLSRLWYPDDAALARNDALTIAAVAIQVVMIAARLETLRELRVILLFHVVGTVMELFKTDVGSWSYAAEGVLRIGAVPLFSGFMYAAVGSYMVRVFRLFELRFTRYPPRWLTGIVAAAIYVNFFSHHFIWDARWVLIAAVIVVWARCAMHVRIFRARLRMPILASFLGVALFIWFAENIATWAGAWAYPDQLDGWVPVSIAKLGSWFLLMIISVVLVTWVYAPRPPSVAVAEVAEEVADVSPEHGDPPVARGLDVESEVRRDGRSPHVHAAFEPGAHERADRVALPACGAGATGAEEGDGGGEGHVVAPRALGLPRGPIEPGQHGADGIALDRPDDVADERELRVAPAQVVEAIPAGGVEVAGEHDGGALADGGVDERRPEARRGERFHQGDLIRRSYRPPPTRSRRGR